MAEFSKIKKVIGLLLWLSITFTASFAGAQSRGFYQELTRPLWAPPGWLFAPVWTALYILMGISAWIVWKQKGFKYAKYALGFYLFQLLLNSLWTWLFFVLQSGALAFFEISLLWVLILITIILFWKIRPIAGILLLPYILWVSFATALTCSVWMSNRNILG
ncbi:MAG: tryptophan-rich sensory protein [Ignavibacteria bacterium]|nr:tryptophan-rich sensory protein [Ignavibacteria bacterium]